WLLLRLDVSGDPCSWCGDRLLLTQQLRLPPTSTLFPYTTLFRSAFPHLRLAETAGIGAVKFGFRHPETVKLQPIALHHQLAAVADDFKTVRPRRLRRVGDEHARCAVLILGVGGDVILHLDVAMLAEMAERPDSPRHHAGDPRPQIQLMGALVDQHAAAFPGPCRPPAAGIVITLRAVPACDDPVGAAQLADFSR